MRGHPSLAVPPAVNPPESGGWLRGGYRRYQIGKQTCCGRAATPFLPCPLQDACPRRSPRGRFLHASCWCRDGRRHVLPRRGSGRSRRSVFAKPDTAPERIHRERITESGSAKAAFADADISCRQHARREPCLRIGSARLLGRGRAHGGGLSCARLRGCGTGRAFFRHRLRYRLPLCLLVPRARGILDRIFPRGRAKPASHLHGLEHRLSRRRRRRVRDEDQRRHFARFRPALLRGRPARHVRRGGWNSFGGPGRIAKRAHRFAAHRRSRHFGCDNRIHQAFALRRRQDFRTSYRGHRDPFRLEQRAAEPDTYAGGVHRPQDQGGRRDHRGISGERTADRCVRVGFLATAGIGSSRRHIDRRSCRRTARSSPRRRHDDRAGRATPVSGPRLRQAHVRSGDRRRRLDRVPAAHGTDRRRGAPRHTGPGAVPPAPTRPQPAPVHDLQVPQHVGHGGRSTDPASHPGRPAHHAWATGCGGSTWTSFPSSETSCAETCRSSVRGRTRSRTTTTTSGASTATRDVSI